MNANRTARRASHRTGKGDTRIRERCGRFAGAVLYGLCTSALLLGIGWALYLLAWIDAHMFILWLRLVLSVASGCVAGAIVWLAARLSVDASIDRGHP